MSDGGAEDREPPIPFAAEMTQASAAMRQTGKWLATAFAAVGAVMVSGLQLSNVWGGDLTTTARFMVMAGFLVSLVGIGGAIWASTTIIAPEFVTLTDVATRPDLRCVANDVMGKRILVPLSRRASDGGALSDSLQEYQDLANEVYAKWRNADSDRAAFDAAKSLQNRWNRSLLQVWHAASYASQKLQFERSRQRMFWWAAAASLGVAAVIAGGSTTGKRDEAGEPRLSRVYLFDEGRRFIAEELGPGCVEGVQREVVVLAQHRDGFDVVTIPTPICPRTFRFVLSPEIGLPLVFSKPTSQGASDGP